MADDNNIPAYPYMFSADQFSNKYSPYAGQALPWPSQYQGTPTDALGRPIQSYLDTQAAHDAWAAANPSMPPSTTLNSRPQVDAMTNQLMGWNMLNGGVPGTTGDPYLDSINGLNSSAAGQSSGNPLSRAAGMQPSMLYGGNQAGLQAQQAATSAAQPTNPYDMNAAYLAALSNPGKVVTRGATVAQAPTPSGQSGVLQQFVQNWQNRGQPTTGAGNYNNAGFFNALQGQV